MSHTSVQTVTLHGANGFDYRSASADHIDGQDAPFPARSDLSLSSLPSSRESSSTSPNSAASNYVFLSPSQGQYGLTPNIQYNVVPHHNASAPSLCPTGPNYPSTHSFEQRPRLNSINPGSALAPLPRHPEHSMPLSPPAPSIKSDYTFPAPQCAAPGFPSQAGLYPIHLSPQSPVPNMPRCFGSSLGQEPPATSGITNNVHENALPGSSQSAPPFNSTRTILPLRDPDGHELRPEITARIEKGFFKVEDDWVCYRRNYFTVLCAFDVGSSDSAAETFFVEWRGEDVQIQGFALTISAKADGEEGKTVELVQHTPKRDKGPMTAPERKEVKSNPGGSLVAPLHGNTMSYPNLGHSRDYDGGLTDFDNQTVASFERMQFKKATANNGKRRAAQQYFFLMVELYGKVNTNEDGVEWVKIAHCMSSRMVVRGRSPGHYQDERRLSAQTGGGSGKMSYNPGHGYYTGSSMDGSMNTSHNPTNFHRSEGYICPQSTINRPPFFHSGRHDPLHPPLNGLGERNFSDDSMGVEESSTNAMYEQYDGEGFGSIPGSPVPRVSHAPRQSSDDSPTAPPPSSYGYPTPMSTKDELRPAPPKIDHDGHHASSPLFSQQPPPMWMAHEPHGPRRDCRPYHIPYDASRPFFHETSAL